MERLPPPLKPLASMAPQPIAATPQATFLHFRELQNRIDARRTPTGPGGAIDVLEELFSKRVPAHRPPRFVARREVHDIRIVAQLIKRLPIKRTLLPRRINEDVRSLVPARVELAPVARKNHVQGILIPPQDMLPMLLQAR